MKLPCAVTRDLLPLYAENMVEQETKALIEEHLDECADCRKKLSEMNDPTEKPVDIAKPLQNLKKQIRLRRAYAAALAALIVFVGVYTYFFRTIAVRLLPWQDGLIEVVGVETYLAEDTQETDEQLVLNVNSVINGFEEHYVADDDGTQTMIIQAVSSNQPAGTLSQSAYEYTIVPVPDRLIYGLQQPQTLLWGTPMEGGVEVLPRLALSFYLLISFAAAIVCGLIWLILRKNKRSWIPRQLFFAPLAYVLSHILLKGNQTTSFFLDRDFISILLVTLAIYGLLSISWQIFLQRRKEA